LIKEHFDKLKVVYTRADKYEGHLAISSYKCNKDLLTRLSNLKNQPMSNKNFTFTAVEDEDLKDFWQKQGGHYQYCIAPKLRIARK